MPTVLFTKGTAGVGDGLELWSTDGTAAGTHLVEDINPGSGSSSPVALGVIGGKMVFGATDDGTNRGVFTTDGSSVTKISPDDVTGVALGGNTAVLGGYLYFSAVDSEHGREIWRTDGTSITRMTDAPESGLVGLSFGGYIYYASTEAATGTELYRFNPVDGDTELLKDISPGAHSSLPVRLTDLGTGKFIFNARDDVQFGNEMWVSDGTPEGTSLLIDLNTHKTSEFSEPSSFAGLYGITPIGGGKAVFAAAASISGSLHDVWGLYVTDGTNAGTMRLSPVNEVFGGSLFVSSGGRAFFQSSAGLTGAELWVTDGTLAGTHIVTDLNPSSAATDDDSVKGYLGGVDVNGTLFFWGNNGAKGVELYKTDGTEDGTVLVKDINVGSGSARIETSPAMTVVGDGIYFNADDGSGAALWRSDGTAGGTVKVSAGGAVALLGVLPGGPTPPTANTITGTKKADKIDGTHAPAGQPHTTNGAEIIDGKAGKDIIKSLGGNDTITGGKGKDVIDGGKGKDAFVFDTKLEASNVDTLVKFKVKDDTIWLDKDIFSKLGTVGETIGDKAFWKSADGKAHDKNDRVIYETDTGKLTYDDNGSKAGHAVLIAMLDKGLALTQADFMVV